MRGALGAGEPCCCRSLVSGEQAAWKTGTGRAELNPQKQTGRCLADAESCWNEGRGKEKILAGQAEGNSRKEPLAAEQGSSKHFLKWEAKSGFELKKKRSNFFFKKGSLYRSK